MPVLTSAPSPERFAKAWARRFGDEVRQAAGVDGRLSRNEARQVAGPFADNAVNYLERTGQKSVSVNKLIAAAEPYAYVQAEAAAGGDGRVSLADGQKLAKDLRLDFFLLRGKEAPSLAAPAARKATFEALYDDDSATWNMPRGWRVVDLRADAVPASIVGTDLHKAIEDELRPLAGTISYDALEMYRNPADGSWALLYQEHGEAFSRLWLFDEHARRVGVMKTEDDGSFAWHD